MPLVMPGVEGNLNIKWLRRLKFGDQPWMTGAAGYAVGDEQLSVFRSISAGNRADLVARKLPRRHTGWIASFAKKAIQTGRRHDPEQQQLVFGSSEPVPRVLGNEYRCALLNWVADIIQGENPPSLQNIEGFLVFPVPVDGNAPADPHLLGPRAKLAEPVAGPTLMKI
jgi:hypothetical protein